MINHQHISTYQPATIQQLVSHYQTLQVTWTSYGRFMMIFAAVTISPLYSKLLNPSMTTADLLVGRQIRPTDNNLKQYVIEDWCKIQTAQP